jgi:hypothetical protein
LNLPEVCVIVRVKYARLGGEIKSPWIMLKEIGAEKMRALQSRYPRLKGFPVYWTALDDGDVCYYPEPVSEVEITGAQSRDAASKAFMVGSSR